MKRNTAKFLAPALTLLAVLATSSQGQGHDPYGTGPMPPGYGMPGGPGYPMGSGMMGPGMMGPGYGPGFHMGPGYGMGMGYGMGPGYGMRPQYGTRQALPRDLGAEEVRHSFEHYLAWQNNPNLKLGTVEEKDADTVVAEIVTKDGSLVDRLEVDRHTGEMRRAN